MSDAAPASTDATPPARAALPAIPGYRIERKLGQGGMASVYLAVQESLGRDVAIKVMAPVACMDEQLAQRFENEARVIAKLEHPGIVGIHEVGRTVDGRLYYVMPYLSRGDLSHRDLTGDETAIVAVLRALLEALAYAHARGVVHRDVKSENVLFDASDRPQLADFGIALSTETAARLTGAGLTLGSGGYMAPEQSRGLAVDSRADLYSVGVLAYELLSGELPFQSDDPLALALMHAHDPVPRLPRGLRHWQPFVDRALSKDPERRFRTANAMLRSLARVERRLRGEVSSLPELWHALVHDPAWRSPWVQMALGVMIAGVIVIALLPRGDEAPAQTSATATAPDAVGVNAQVVARALDVAEEQFDTGAVIQPAGANAAETWIGVLRLDPQSQAAIDGIARVFDWLLARWQGAVDELDRADALARFEEARLLADSAGAAGDAAWRDFRRRAAAILERRVLDADARGDEPARRFADALRRSLDLVPADAEAIGDAGPARASAR